MHLLNKLVVASIPLVPRRIIRYFAGRYIAGETLPMAVDCVRQLNAEKVCATMDVLGEDITTRAEAIASRDQLHRGPPHHRPRKTRFQSLHQADLPRSEDRQGLLPRERP